MSNFTKVSLVTAAPSISRISSPCSIKPPMYAGYKIQNATKNISAPTPGQWPAKRDERCRIYRAARYEWAHGGKAEKSAILVGEDSGRYPANDHVIDHAMCPIAIRHYPEGCSCFCCKFRRKSFCVTRLSKVHRTEKREEERRASDQAQKVTRSNNQDVGQEAQGLWPVWTSQGFFDWLRSRTCFASFIMSSSFSLCDLACSIVSTIYAIIVSLSVSFFLSQKKPVPLHFLYNSWPNVAPNETGCQKDGAFGMNEESREMILLLPGFLFSGCSLLPSKKRRQPGKISL